MRLITNHLKAFQLLLHFVIFLPYPSLATFLLTPHWSFPDRRFMYIYINLYPVILLEALHSSLHWDHSGSSKNAYYVLWEYLLCVPGQCSDWNPSPAVTHGGHCLSFVLFPTVSPKSVCISYLSWCYDNTLGKGNLQEEGFTSLQIQVQTIMTGRHGSKEPEAAVPTASAVRIRAIAFSFLSSPGAHP